MQQINNINKKMWLLLLILILPLAFILAGCSNTKPFEGEICELEFKESYTTTLLLPITIYNGTTTTTMLVPYIRTYPDRYYVKVRNYNEEKQNYDYYDCYVTKECFENLEIGVWFVYDEDYCFPEEPYTQVRE